MPRCRYLILMRLVLMAVAFSLGLGQGWAQAPPKEKKLKYRGGRLTTKEKKDAAIRLAKKGLLPGIAGLDPMAATPLPAPEGPGGVPHYFGPYANWAFSPLPRGPVGEMTVVDGGTGYSAATTVVEVRDAYLPSGDYTPAGVTAQITDGVITGFAFTETTLGTQDRGSGYIAPVLIITDDTGTGAIADAIIGGPLTGGIPKFVNSLPGLTPAGANNNDQDPVTPGIQGQYIPLAVPETRMFSGQAADYYEIALVEYTEKMHSALPPTRLRGYVQLSTNGTGIALMQVDGVTPILKPDGTQAMAVDRPHYLGPIILAQGRVHGIEAADPTNGKPKPVRIKFYNLLPTGAGGDLFLPVDETVPGAGIGPALPGQAGDKYTQNRAAVHLHGNNTVWISDGNVHQWLTPASENTHYPKGVSVRNVPDMLDANGNVECDGANSGCMTFFYTNAQSARLQFYHDHAHGITRLNVYAGEAAGYVVTDAVDQDMINGTNVTGVNPGLLKVLPDIGIPLVIQDRTFVEADTIWAQDPTWNSGTAERYVASDPEVVADPTLLGKVKYAVNGDLWYPHVYMTVQNPWDLTGTNGFGRWHYGPWFNPPVPECVNGGPVGCIEVGPVANPYYQPVCDGLPDAQGAVCDAPWEPPLMPGNPNPSIPGESFLDTQLVNGTAYPYLEVEPRAYRFRILNASNDRFVNLQLYVAADKNTPTTPGTTGTVLCNGQTGQPAASDCTEVKMVPVDLAPANQYADTPSGIPDPATKGPAWIQIGTEGGFMPKPIVVPQQPIGYNLDPAYFSFGLVNQHSIFLGAAERADVVVDFSGLGGKTFILYNDSPAPVPAGAAPYDFFTGNGNQMDGGGAPNTQPGYGPNTRTIMQIRVKSPAGTDKDTTQVTLANLQAVFAKSGTKRGVFEVSQDPIIIPQAEYNSAYNANPSFPTTAAQQYVQIAETSKTFRPIDPATGQQLTTPVTLPLEMKAMHDEMGGVYDTMFGRMSGMLGMSLLNSPNHVLVPYGLAAPPTDLVMGSLEWDPVAVMPDGTQIWRIFHNGVDTHPVHTHLFHAQLINRVDQSGQVTGGTLPVDPNDLGWKDTFKINPLEVTYLAMRPTIPSQSQVPFEVPDSVRLIDPTLPEGATLIPPPPAGWFDPSGVQIPQILNHYVNFGWEYVWHCHILSHEEMDMMHTLPFVVPPMAPTDLSLVSVTGNGNNRTVTLSWEDNSTKEVRFTIQRATDANFTTGLTTYNYTNPSPSGPVTWTNSARTDTRYWYMVFAIGPTVGDTQVYPAPSIGFPTMSANSVATTAISNNMSTVLEVAVGNPPAAPTPPAAPSDLQASPAGLQVSLVWVDNAPSLAEPSPETGFVLERCTVVSPATTCGNFAQIAAPGASTGSGLFVNYTDSTVAANSRYMYRVKAVNAAGSSAFATLASPVLVGAIPAPTNFTVTNTPRNGANTNANLSWSYDTIPTNFTIQRATNLSFTTGLNTATVAGTARALTQSVSQNTTYYYRIRANTPAGSSAWTNALPFPIRTGPQ